MEIIFDGILFFRAHGQTLSGAQYIEKCLGKTLF